MISIALLQISLFQNRHKVKELWLDKYNDLKKIYRDAAPKYIGKYLRYLESGSIEIPPVIPKFAYLVNVNVVK